MKTISIICLIFLLVNQYPAKAQNPDQIKQLQELKKLYESGLISKEVNDQRQREILDQGSALVRNRALRSASVLDQDSGVVIDIARADPKALTVLVHSLAGMWRVTYTERNENGVANIFSMSSPSTPELWMIKYSNGKLYFSSEKKNQYGKNVMRPRKLLKASIDGTNLVFATESSERAEAYSSTTSYSYMIDLSNADEIQGNYDLTSTFVTEDERSRSIAHGSLSMIRTDDQGIPIVDPPTSVNVPRNQPTIPPENLDTLQSAPPPPSAANLSEMRRQLEKIKKQRDDTARRADMISSPVAKQGTFAVVQQFDRIIADLENRIRRAER